MVSVLSFQSVSIQLPIKGVFIRLTQPTQPTQPQVSIQLPIKGVFILKIKALENDLLGFNPTPYQGSIYTGTILHHITI